MASQRGSALPFCGNESRLCSAGCGDVAAEPLSCSPVLHTETGPIDPVLIEKYNTPGFVGCLSRVQFNGVAPLKLALRSRVAAPVSIQGKLVESNCGATPLTISPMSAATDPWHLDSGRHNSRSPRTVPTLCAHPCPSCTLPTRCLRPHLHPAMSLKHLISHELTEPSDWLSVLIPPEKAYKLMEPPLI